MESTQMNDTVSSKNISSPKATMNQPFSTAPVSGPSNDSGPAAAHAPCPVPLAIDDSWVNAFHDIQRQTADAHISYQKSMAESHVAFLKTMEASTLTLTRMLDGSPLTGRTNTEMGAAMPPPAFKAPYPSAIIVPEPLKTGRPLPVLPTSLPALETPMPVIEKKREAPPVEKSGEEAPPALPEGVDFKEMLLSIVAEKTGYPREILGEEMGLEADLGIDSIKRVEILSAVKDESPWLPEVDPSEMGNIETLGDVIRYIEKAAPRMTTARAPFKSLQKGSASAPPMEAPEGVDFKEMLLSIVAEKTGYPREILGEEMGLEADLGIDSIKRVEILSAVKDESPWLPEVDPSEMGNIETLGDVIRYIEKAAPSISKSKKRGGAAPVPEPLQETGKAIPQGVDFKEMLLAIVAEKTGYPRDILTEEMGLEADLGIDSIKRVEILSAVKDESPWLPEVDPSEMGNIETLKDVIDYIERMAPSVKKPSPALRAEAPLAPETGRAPSSGLPAGIDFKEMLLKIVAEKTGYPRDILTMEMGLEADLGIDSIKRVEILSAVKDESPWLPEIDPADMAAIETLKDVVDFVEKALPGMNKEVSEEAAVGPGKTQSAVGAAPKLGRYLLREVEAPYSGFAMKGLKTARLIAITDDGNGVAQALEAVLRLRNINARAVKSIPAEADGLIFLGGLKQISGPEEAMAVNREAFLAVKSLAPAFASSGALLVTVQDTGGDFGLSGACGPRFLMAGLTGLVKTAAIEWLDLPVKAIDIDSAQKTPQEIAKEISKELLNGGPEIEVGLKADGGRVRLDSYEQDVNPEEARIDQQAVIVASGGARGVTAKTLIALAQATRCSLVLLGRTPLTGEPAFLSAAATDGDLKKALLEEAKQKGKKITPAELGREAGQILAIREIKATLKAIEEAGSRVRYLETDVQDEEKLSHELDGIRKEWGPVTGIVHGAGV
jgi:acyl carrier protein